MYIQKVISKKTRKKYFFLGVLKVTDEKDPYPYMDQYQNVTDPENWSKEQTIKQQAPPTGDRRHPFRTLYPFFPASFGADPVPDSGEETLQTTKQANLCAVISVADLWHFGTKPDPRIHASDYWIRIRIWIRILLFSSLTFKTPTKN